MLGHMVSYCRLLKKPAGESAVCIALGLHMDNLTALKIPPQSKSPWAPMDTRPL